MEPAGVAGVERLIVGTEIGQEWRDQRGQAQFRPKKADFGLLLSIALV